MIFRSWCTLLGFVSLFFLRQLQLVLLSRRPQYQEMAQRFIHPLISFRQSTYVCSYLPYPHMQHHLIPSLSPSSEPQSEPPLPPAMQQPSLVSLQLLFHCTSCQESSPFTPFWVVYLFVLFLKQKF